MKDLAWCLEGLAGVAVTQGEMAHGARLFGAAASLHEFPAAHRDPSERAGYERNVMVARAALGEAAFAAAWAAGGAMTLEETIADALDDTPSAEAEWPSSGEPDRSWMRR